MIFSPYKIKGRWYKIFIESYVPEGETDSALKITTSDLKNVELTGNFLKFPEKFHCLHTMYDFNTEGGEATTLKSLDIIMRRYGDGKQAVSVGSADAFDYAEVYVYGYFGK